MRFGNCKDCRTRDVYLPEDGLCKDCVDKSSEEFIITIDTTLEMKRHTPWTHNDCEFVLKTNSDKYRYDYDVVTDSNVRKKGVTGDLTLEFDNPGEHELRFSGKLPHICYNKRFSPHSIKIIGIKQWGEIEWESMQGMFNGAGNLRNYRATDTPDLSNVKSTADMFSLASKFNGDISDWDTRNIEHMENMFRGAHNFNQDIGDWDTSNVEDMKGMFQAAHNFNQDIGDWDTSNVENMKQMFVNSYDFNGDISDWDTSNVEVMENMFNRATSFNQDIGNWDVSNVENMLGMFCKANSFNQDIGNWDVSNVENMLGMFEEAELFNQGISDWDTSNVEDMSHMFYMASSFNRDVSNWDVTSLHSSSKPDGFDKDSGFEGKTSKHPRW